MNQLIPTAEQESILAFGRDSRQSLLINALAGAAKTSTLVMLAHSLPTNPILCLAFNKRIAEAMGKRMPGHVQCLTLNSAGHRAWARHTGRKLIIDTAKTYNLVKDAINALKPRKRDAFDWSLLVRAVGIAKANGYVPASHTHLAPSLISQSDLSNAIGAQCDEEPSDDALALIDDVLAASIKNGYAGGIDFDDQIYLPTLFGRTFPRFPTVLVDEAQDLSPLNHLMLSTMKPDRLIAVGDPFQCHPPGTKIMLTGGTEIEIEKLVGGEKLVSYYTQKSVFKGLKTQGRALEKIHTENFTGELIEISTDYNCHRVTPNHRCLVRYAKDPNAHALYLMRRGYNYRIGVARLQYKGASGPSMRARQEKADAAWILDVYPSKETACFYESIYCAVYGIPELLFQDPFGEQDKQELLDMSWQLIGDNTDRAIEILHKF